MRFAPAALSCLGVGGKQGVLLEGGGPPDRLLSVLVPHEGKKGGHGTLFLLSVSKTFWTQRLAFSSQTGEHPLPGALTPEVPVVTHWPRKGWRGVSDVPRVCAECSVCACVFLGTVSIASTRFSKRGCNPEKRDPQTGLAPRRGPLCGAGPDRWAARPCLLTGAGPSQ